MGCCTPVSTNSGEQAQTFQRQALDLDNLPDGYTKLYYTGEAAGTVTMFVPGTNRGYSVSRSSANNMVAVLDGDVETMKRYGVFVEEDAVPDQLRERFGLSAETAT